MATTGFDTTHGDIIHDVQMDYYGRRIATCSSDRTICIFEVSTEAPVRTAQLMGHSGPVWQVSWAHPRFGNILASCSYDRRIIVWKEAQQNQWIQIYTYDQHNSSVNSVAWAPHEYGLVLAAGSADGTISIHSYKEHDPWTVFTQDAHHGGTNSVSWAPSTYTKSEETQYLASAGCDGSTTIWRRADKKWIPVKQLSQSKSWLRGISWAPNLGLPGFVIATCSQDGSVCVWKTGESHQPEDNWACTRIPRNSKDPAWTVSWSLTGNMLAVSSGENQISMYKEGPADTWTAVSTLSETSQPASHEHTIHGA
eukprot:TRINITY_DN8711_c0_g1_i2.p1 TRINITY_DN8711_c0_g1~~TRINITY_DN8711_c0_g1_i2.p1  ORF type:complete len:310 (+),score=59.31 TRINITY_DN8711_c0_g1_i2:91-1020(+)